MANAGTGGVDAVLPSSLRPGIRLGEYPLRDDERAHVLERALGYLLRLARRPAAAGPALPDGFMPELLACERQVKALHGPELEAFIERTRGRLLVEGFAAMPVARAFALARELAHRSLGMRHYDVQLLGGWIMLHGGLAEMRTGEGKTLAATLPACVAALAGVPVHVVSVNDYLVERDFRTMAPLYHALGLSVGRVTAGMGFGERKAAYACDVTYCSNKQLAFDYLKDRLVLEAAGGCRGIADSLMLQGLCYAIVDEADSVLIDEARTPLILSGPSGPDTQEADYRQAMQLAARLVPDAEFETDARHREARLTGRGKQALESLASGLRGVWSNRLQREALVCQALGALYLFESGRHYLVRDGQVLIVDENTGRVMPDRSWEHGLHQLIEVKEGCAVTGQRRPLARTSYQGFFRRYLRLAGMTGTARELRTELASVYGLDMVPVPTARPVRLQRDPDRYFWRVDDKWRAVVGRVSQLHAQGRPVLVGTRSVSDSEHLGRLLQDAGLPHSILNARQDRDEARIVRQAGGAGRITVATNMAGRGTDIKLSDSAIKAGGLHVIAADLNFARRIGRQLAGRCARQGEPGSCQAILSMQDEVVEVYCRRMARLLERVAGANGAAVNKWLGKLVTGAAVRLAERHHARVRAALLRADEQRGKLLAFAGRPD